MVATVGDPTGPVIIHTSKLRGAELTSSYEEETAALLQTLDWAGANCPTERIPICSDSQSLFKSIQSSAHYTQSTRQLLDNRKGPQSSSGFQFKGIPSNEAADELAKAAATATYTSPTRGPDASHLPPRKPSSDAPSPTSPPTDPERKISPGR